MSAEVFTVGEAMLRLWVPPGQRLEDTPTLHVSVAGAESNVAIAVARMGRSVAWASRVPDSPLGRRVVAEIGRHGVDVSAVTWVPEGRLGTYYVEASVPPRPVSIVYDRAGSVASEIGVDDIPWEAVRTASVVHLTGITPGLSDTNRETTFEVARQARGSGVTVAVDVNYRAKLWPPAAAGPVLTTLCRLADLVILTEEDARDVFGLEGDAQTVLGEIGDRFGAAHVVLSHGRTGASWRSGGACGRVAAHEAQVVDRIGAGDAFAGGVLVGLLEGDVGHGVEYGAAMAALKLGMEGDQLRTNRAEVDALMTGRNRQVSR